MVSEKRQAVDSAFIKANASMDSLLEKEVLKDACAFVSELDSTIRIVKDLFSIRKKESI